MIRIGTDRKRDETEEPIGFLMACHARILERLATLERIGDAIEGQPAAALEALQNTLRFFDISGRLHTQDEEISVFPRLRQALPAEEAACLSHLEMQHDEHESACDQLRRSADDVMTGVTAENAHAFREIAARVAWLYRAHIAEEEEFLRRAAGSLTSEELDAIRREMRTRRRTD